MPLLGKVKTIRWMAPMLVFSVLLVMGCSSDDDSFTGGQGEQEMTDSTVIALTYHHFIASDDVIIMDADTTQISVSKTLADKLGITHFSGRPMAIWQKVNCLPYIRRATSESLKDGRYILTVDKSASLADVLPEDAEINFDTRIHVNHQAAKSWSHAGGSNLVEDISSRYMEGDTIHPAVILYTGEGGAGEDVQVTLDEDGVASYDIKEGSAWDNIPFTPEIEALARQCKAVCFGSLAQRNEVSRNTIYHFLDATPKDCMRIFDINLRQNFHSKEVIQESLKRSNVMKINDEELVLIGRMFGYPGLDIENKCWLILGKYNLDMLILTCGVNGSYVFSKGAMSYLETPKVEVADTVGAGDSFTGSFVASVLSGMPIAEAHRIGVNGVPTYAHRTAPCQ